MAILDSLAAEAKKRLCGRQDNLRVDNIVLGKSLYTMKSADTIFTDMNFCLVLLENAYGFSYFQDEIDYSIHSFVNRNALELIDEELPIHARVALTDALYCVINQSELAHIRILRGNIRQKANERARILLATVPRRARILLLGAAAEIIEEAKHKECSLRVLDLEKQKVGLKFFSTKIENGVKTDLEKAIEGVDYVIATGMLFASKTDDQVFELVRKSGKTLILYMQTGSNFGPRLLDYGADTILSELFPYYDFCGDTKYLLINRRDADCISESSEDCKNANDSLTI